MSFSRNPNVGVKPDVAPEIHETTGAGPLATISPTSGASSYAPPRRVPARFRGMERAGFWVIVVAALVVLLVLMGFVLKPVIGGVITGAYIGFFVGGLTLMNLRRPSGWANTILGRRIFPVLSAQDADLWRLAGVNAGLTFVFATAFTILSAFLGALLSGILVFGGLVALGIFYNRARGVIIQP